MQKLSTRVVREVHFSSRGSKIAKVKYGSSIQEAKRREEKRRKDKIREDKRRKREEGRKEKRREQKRRRERSEEKN